MNNILDEIVERKRRDLEAKKAAIPLQQLKAADTRLLPLRDFKAAVAKMDQVNIVAEIKKASPSSGMIVEGLDVERIAGEYGRGGAAAISVLTEEKYFLGDLSYIEKAKRNSNIPVLRKDFIFDPYQVHESLAAGADAILLIAALLTARQVTELVELSSTLGLACLVEVHTEEELEQVLSTPASIIGVNSRDLRDFSVDLNRVEKIIARIPRDRTALVESGIKSSRDMAPFYRMGVRTFLIGETLMRSPDIQKTLKELGVSNG